MNKEKLIQMWKNTERSTKGLFFVIVALVIVILIGLMLLKEQQIMEEAKEKERPILAVEKPVIDEQMLTVNQYSRPQIKLKEVNNIVIHYTANPGSTAQNNRDYFESLATSGATYASSHFIIGIDGEIIQCVPLDEISYCSNNRNDDTVAIEVCHPDDTGEFTKESYNSLVKLTAWLCYKFQLQESEIIRHYDITGKECPKYFVDYPQEFTTLKKKVGELIHAPY